MRALNLFFRLHRPYQLKPLDEIKTGYFGGEAEFREANRTEYQPFLALLERNSQKYPNFKVILSVSGLFLEQAEKWDQEIIRRLHRLAKARHIQFTVEPYDYSVAMFYNQGEFEKQVERHKTKLEQLFGGDLSVLALPELIYNDKLALWAEKAGYKAIIAGAADKILDWRSTGQVYAAQDCKKLKVLFQNTRFSRAIMTGDEDFLMVEEAVKPIDFSEDSTDVVEKVHPSRTQPHMTAADFVAAMSHKSRLANTVSAESPKVPQVMRGSLKFSAQKYKKHLDIEMLRGNLMNICLGTEIFAEFHSAGVIRFFDDLIGNWLKSPNNFFLTASEVLEKFTASARFSVPTTVSWRGEFELVKKPGLSVLEDVRACLPEWLRFQRQIDASRTLYRLRENVRRTEDEQLYEDFSRLTALDYLLKMNTHIPPLVGAFPRKADEAEVRGFYGYFMTLVEDLAVRVREKMPMNLALESGDIETTKASSVPKDQSAKQPEKPQPEEDFSVKVHRVAPKKPVERIIKKEETADGEVKIQFGAGGAAKFGWDEIALDDDMEVISYSEDELAKYLAAKMNVTIEEVEERTEEEQVLAERLQQKHDELEQDLDNLAEAELVVDKSARFKKRKRRQIL